MKKKQFKENRKKKTLLHVAGGYVNTSIIIVQGIVLIPFYLKYIGSHQYGLWLATGGIVGMLGLLTMGSGSILMQRVASGFSKNNMHEVGRYFANGFLVYLIVSIVIIFGGWIVSYSFYQIFNLNDKDSIVLTQCFRLAVLSLSISTINECLRCFSQALLNPVIPHIGMAVGRICGIFCSIIILVFDYGLWAIPIGAVVTELICLCINSVNSLYLVRRFHIVPSLDKNTLKEYATTSPYLFSSKVGDTLAHQSEPLLITLFLSAEITTAYMITRRAADIVLTFLNVLIASIMGSFSHLVGEENIEKIKEITNKLIVLFILVSLIGFTTYLGGNRTFIQAWVGNEYYLGSKITFIISFGFLMRAIKGMNRNLLFGLADFKSPSILILLEGSIRILIAVSLFQFFGILSVPTALAVSGFLVNIFLFIRIKSKLGAIINLNQRTRMFFAFAILFSFSYYFSVFEISIHPWSIFIISVVVVSFVNVAIVFAINRSIIRSVFMDFGVGIQFGKHSR